MSAPAVDVLQMDHLAGQFDRWKELTSGHIDRFVSDNAPGGSRVIDVGCGTGRHLRMLAGRYRTLLGIDPGADLLAYARKRTEAPNVDYRQGELWDASPTTDGPAEVVICTYAMHHVTAGGHTSTLWDALQHLANLVAPGGTLIVVDVVGPWPYAPRWWLIKEAWRLFLTRELWRRSWPQAWEALRLSTDRGWLDHVTTNRLFTPVQFATTAVLALPGANVVEGYRSVQVLWRREPSQTAHSR